MGSGKSTYGKKLAARLSLPFSDLDELIELRENKTVQAIFSEQGEDYFRQKEHELLKQLIATPQKQVVALGGGSICFYNNLQLVKSSGLLVYLELPALALFQRLSQAQKTRPLLNNLRGEELLKHITQRLGERKKYYSQAHITLNGLNLTAQQLYQHILDFEAKNNN